MAAKGDDSDEYESFEVNDTDLQYAINPMGRRRMTKNQQIYGMWADREDSDDEGRTGFGGKKKSKNYSAPISFVSGGIKQGSKVEAKENDEDDERKLKVEDLSDSDDDKPIELMSFPREKKKKETNYKPDIQSFAGMRGMKGVDTAKFGDWEKYTRGIGRKLLEKYGYKHGEGLGSEGQGIAEPVKAAKRPGRGAIGSYGPEVKGPKFRKDQKDTKEDEEESSEEDERKKPTGQWRKEAGRNKVKYKYRTVDEVIAEGGLLHKRISGAVGGQHSTKVIDMTGKQQKVYSGYEAFTTKTKDPVEEVSASTRKAFDMPELTYNLDLLVEMTEEEIVRNDRQLKYLKDQNVAIKHDEQQLSETIEGEEKQMERMKQVIELVEDFGKRCENSNETTLEDCRELFVKLQQDYYEEYKLFGLSALAISNVMPLVKRKFENWHPLIESEFGTDTMREWRTIVEEPNSTNWSGAGASVDQMDSYHRLLWEAWMPRVRQAALNWNPKEQCEQMLKLVENWASLLPKWMLENLLELIILPRLQTEVENWNPLTDTVPIHIWLHPWLLLMGDRLQPVYPPIRHKLSRALLQWHPSDPSAKQILKPWKDVFKPGTMENFLAQNIVPKLDQCLSTFTVNPADQKLDVWNWIMVWLDMISPAVIAQMLLRNFFPKWLDALFAWLSCPNPNYEEISQWYTGWKNLYPRVLMDIPLIKEKFTIALDMMNRAVSGGSIQRPSTGPSAADAAASMAQHQRNMAFLANAGGGGPANFKDLVERKAVDRGIQFIPVPNKYREGKQIYWFGTQQIYVDRNVVFVQQEQLRWAPIGLEELLTIAC